MRHDYNMNIGARDGISLNEVEDMLDTKVFLGTERNLPKGISLQNGLLRSEGQTAGGITIAKFSGGVANRVTSTRVFIAPALRGYDLNFRNMIFKHEFMHVWHANKFPSQYHLSERATSSYSHYFAKSFGYRDYLNIWKPDIAPYPSSMNWRNFEKILPLWLMK